MSILHNISRAFPDHKESWVDESSDPAAEPISFYKRAELVRVRNDKENPHSMAAYVVAREEVFHLDGSLGSIQKVNDKEKLSLGKKQVPEYIRFVFNHTGDGRLKVVENVNEIQWDELSLGQPGAAERVEDVRRSIHAIQVSKAAGKSFLVVFNGMFRDLLVECEMELARTGELTPVSKTPVCQDLPVSEG